MKNANYKNIKSFEDACAALGIDPSKLPDVSLLPEEFGAALVANYKLWVINRAINGDWKPNWKDDEEYKYFPYFYITEDEESASGVGFSYDGCVYDGSHSGVGSRLVFETRDQAEYAGETFLELYREVHLFEK